MDRATNRKRAQFWSYRGSPCAGVGSLRLSAWLCVAHLGWKKVLSLLPLRLQLNCTIIVLSSATLTLNTLATLSTHIAYGQWPYCVDFSTIVRLQKALPEYEGKTGIKLISYKISSFSKWEQQHTRGLLMFSILLYVKLAMIASIHLVKTHILICQNPHLNKQKFPFLQKEVRQDS